MAGDAVARMRDLAARARDIQLQLDSMGELEKELTQILSIDLVSIMNEVGQDAIGLPAEGNMPGFDLELGPYYRAAVLKGWDDARKEAAFLAVPELVKWTVTVPFSVDQHEDAQKLADWLTEQGYSIIIEKGIHHATLTAWLKRQVEEGGELPDLETIGATIGQRVKIKQRRD